VCRSVKYYFRVDVSLSRETPDGRQETSARFYSPPTATSDPILDLNDVVAIFEARLSDFTCRGSGWSLEGIDNLVLAVAPYRPLVGSSYIKTPPEIAGKRAVLNIQNRRDELCFLYSVLAHAHPVPAENNPQLPSKYEKYLPTLNYEGLQFPLAVQDVPRFERMNPNYSINILACDKKDFCPLYVSPHRGRLHHVNLLLLSSHGKFHYTLIRNLSRLVAGRTNHVGKTYVCPYCLHPFR
jgi:hypothetical protein